MGKCFSQAGGLYTPTYTKKGGTQYRYYLQKTTGHRIKGPDLESLVIDTIRLLAHEPKHWELCWKSCNKLMAEEAQHLWEMLWASWSGLPNDCRQQVARQVIDRIIITKDQLTVRLSYAGISKVLDNVKEVSICTAEKRNNGYRPHIAMDDQHLEITIPARFEVYGRSQIAVDSDGRSIRAFKRSNFNPVLVNALVKSYRWNQQLDSGQVTITELAKSEGMGRTYISRVVNLMYLAPEIISGIMNGTQPTKMHLQDLIANLPVEWHRQKQLLKFSIFAD